MERILHTWGAWASHFIGSCFDVAKPYIDKDYRGIDPQVRFVSTQLYIDCHLSSESSLLLVGQGKEWDADLITRSIMEGSVKYAYMLIGSDAERKNKAVEYWELLPEFSSIKRSDRARAFLSDIGTPNDPEWIPLRDLVLSDEEASRIRAKYSKRERQMLEQKWSFSGIIGEFLKSNDEGLKAFGKLVYGYGMSSHLVHKDGDGVGMVWERYQRDPERKATAIMGHSARIVGDLCTYAKIRLLMLLKACSENPDVVLEVEAEYALLFDEIRKAGEHFVRVEYGETG